MRVACVKFGGLSAGGTERWLQETAVQLAPTHEVTFFYCDAAPYRGSTFRHPQTSPERKAFLESHGVELVEFEVGEKDTTTPLHVWRDTNFWELFDEDEFDVVQTAIAGPSEYPYYLLNTPVVEFIALNAGANEFPENVLHSVHLSEWQRKRWIERGGDPGSSSVIPIPVRSPETSEDLRSRLDIPEGAVVAGFHQRAQDEIFSPIPLAAFSSIEATSRYFVVMGGSSAYRAQAEELGIRNARFVDHSADPSEISRFLNTLDVFAHGRLDGETYGSVLAEALMHGKPCLSHESEIANAQPETMGSHGIFVRNQDEYATELLGLMADSKRRERLASGAREFAESRYSLDAFGEQLRALYAEIETIVRAGDQPRRTKRRTWPINPRRLLAELRRSRIRRVIIRERRGFEGDY